MVVYTAAPGKDINTTRALWTLAVEFREAVISGFVYLNIFDVTY